MKAIKIFLLIIAVVIAYKAKSATIENIRILYSSYIRTTGFGSNLDISVIQIDKCEYIVTTTTRGNGSVSMIHKHNCSYCYATKRY